MNRRILQMIDLASTPVRVTVYAKASRDPVVGDVWASGVSPEGRPFSVYGTGPVKPPIQEVTPAGGAMRKTPCPEGKPPEKLERQKEREGYRLVGNFFLVRREGKLKLVEASWLRDEDFGTASDPDGGGFRSAGRPPLAAGVLHQQEGREPVGPRGGWVF